MYTLAADGKPQPVTIKMGISDGVATEVLEGLNENDNVVTSVVVTQAKAAQPTSPFGGGVRRF